MQRQLHRPRWVSVNILQLQSFSSCRVHKASHQTNQQQQEQHQEPFHEQKQSSGYAKYWDAWKNTKTEWYALPVSLGIAWIAVRHFMKLREQEAQKASRGHSEDELPIQPTGPYWIHIYTLLPWRAISRAWGWMNNLIVPEALRSPIYRFYSNAFGCKLDEMLEPDLKTYSNLAEFFYRELKKGVRPIAGLDRAMLVSPADGRVLHFGPVDSHGRIEQVKGLSYAVDALLGPSSLSVHSGTSPTPSSKETSFFQIVIYLAPGDYHRFHSPADWSVSQVRHFAGELFSVSPKLAHAMNHLFVVNERVVMLGKWKYGFFSMVPVGATNVGSIRINMCPELETNVAESSLPLGAYELSVKKTLISRGEEIGGFRLGSTVVLVFEAPSSFQFSVEAGQLLQVGQPLGK
ncbi:hypothetical protein BASA61_002490 [Batrachochytrium salamandrivorans]|nr:hypothetical protein BASA60_000393 [Batrachochytrium salamandrivorans]KAH6599722.1 hypothetical protein BASA61_002490 [Batrachochytrium salamandrivorans]